MRADEASGALVAASRRKLPGQCQIIGLLENWRRFGKVEVGRPTDSRAGQRTGRITYRDTQYECRDRGCALYMQYFPVDQKTACEAAQSFILQAKS